jgi:hypothetical protein
MWYFITIIRAGQTWYVISPNYGAYALAPSRERNTYLWETEASARADSRWQHLIQPGDDVRYNRIYRG